MIKIRALRIVAPLVAAGLLATACSSGGGGSAASTAAPTSAAAASSATLSLTDGHLVDSSGKTVYLWVADPGSTSTCTGSCATAWPPVPASGTPTAGSGVTASKITTSTRPDGSSQLDYDGHPLYYFIQDKAAGDTTGQGSNSFGAKWWELNAAGAAITTAPAATSAAPGAGNGY